MFQVQKKAEKEKTVYFCLHLHVLCHIHHPPIRKFVVVGQELFMLCAAVKIEHDVTGYSMPKYM